MKIYLDNCCLNRPNDDLSVDKIKIESEAVLTIIDCSKSRNWTIFSSDVLLDEIERNPDLVKKEKVLTLYSSTSEHIDINDTIIMRARVLEGIGFKPYDALHIACAEYGNANVFLTTDKKLINAAKRVKKIIDVKNPAQWILEVLLGE